MRKALLYLIFVPLYLLITFFGMGPVMIADGSATERLLTFLAVLVVYVLVTVLFRWLLGKVK